MNTKIINIFGNPGSGKSTVAAYLFAELKAKGYEVELVTETAKDLVWDEDTKRLNNQPYVFSTQLHRLERLVGKVKYIITDSPLLMQIGYYKERSLPASKAFTKLVEAYNKRFNNINIWLKANKEISEIGRAELSLNPMKYITKYNYDFKTDCTQKEEILKFILERTEIKMIEYVRTSDGGMYGVENTGDDLILLCCNKSIYDDISGDVTVVGHNRNVIELLKCGDMVNGEKVMGIDVNKQYVQLNNWNRPVTANEITEFVAEERLKSITFDKVHKIYEMQKEEE